MVTPSRMSYARPGKLFSANASIMQRLVGTLNFQKCRRIVEAVIAVLRGDSGSDEFSRE